MRGRHSKMPPLLLFFSVAVAVLAGAGDASPERDIYALFRIKDALTSASSSDSLSDWSATAVPPQHCSFSGVTCNSDHRVTSLNLSFLAFHGGRLAPEIALLDCLENFTATSSFIAHDLPAAIARAPSLRFFNVSVNNLTGELPAFDDGVFPALEVFDVYNNNFTGPLPVFPAAARRSLQHVHLGGNYFTGAIPEEYSEMENLESLAFNGNELSGVIPASLARLRKIKELYLGYFNAFDGGVPPEFGNMTTLVKLDAASCNLSGPIPAELGNLKNLTTLFLQMNRLTGPIPASLGSLESIESLDLSINDLVGEIPPSFSGLKTMKLLNLFRNHLTGGIPEFIAELPLLEVLELWGNNFTGALPDTLGMNKKLLKLDVATNHLTGRIPGGLCDGGRLQLLVLMENAFFGPIPESLGGCKSLQRIRLGKNELDGAIPAGLLDLPYADMIELSDNLLSGDLPAMIAGNNIGMLLLGNNQISGGIPPAIGNLSSLQSLSLECNQFTGPIPPEIGKLQQLSKLNMSANRLTGAIPPGLGECVSLAALDLSRNNLTGEIPDSLTSLRILSTLNLSRNHIGGGIPEAIAKMTSLTSLDLSSNDLAGPVPMSGQFLVFNESSFAGNPGLCGNRLRTLPSCGIDTPATNVPAGMEMRRLLLWLCLAIIFLAMLLVAVRKGRAVYKSAAKRKSGKWKMTAFQKLDFTVDDVIDCLKDDNIIGKGGAGIVYHGVTRSGTEVAIKRLVGRGGTESDRGFGAEVTTLGRIRHRNIVRLLGFVTNREANLLLYEYMPNGSLGEMLHGSKGAHLGWQARRRVAAEAALGLCYLHHDCTPRILHRDVKSNNILLDSAFEAHVADFGLAKFIGGAAAASECMSAIAGSYGYIAPEYAYTLRVDEKSDVYSFGIVLLELVTGRRPVGSFGEGVDIVNWVKKTAAELPEPADASAAAIAVADPRLPQSPMGLIVGLYKVAMLCVEEQSTARPTMREVVHMLSGPMAAHQDDLVITF